MTQVLRLATEADLESINQIYNHYVLQSTCTYQLDPESMADRRIWFQEHQMDRYPVTVVESESRVVGWGSLSKWRPRAAMAPTVEATVYIDHTMHRRGLGKLILGGLIARAKQIGFHSIIGSVSAEQTASIALQISLGFRRVAHLSEVGVKFGQRLDLLYMQLMLETELT